MLKSKGVKVYNGIFDFYFHFIYGSMKSEKGPSQLAKVLKVHYRQILRNARLELSDEICFFFILLELQLIQNDLV